MQSLTAFCATNMPIACWARQKYEQLRLTRRWQLRSLRSLHPNPGQANCNETVVKRADGCIKRKLLLRYSSSLDFANPCFVKPNPTNYNSKKGDEKNDR